LVKENVGDVGMYGGGKGRIGQVTRNEEKDAQGLCGW